jgi:hypothetical protein
MEITEFDCTPTCQDLSFVNSLYFIHISVYISVYRHLNVDNAIYIGQDFSFINSRYFIYISLPGASPEDVFGAPPSFVDPLSIGLFFCLVFVFGAPRSFVDPFLYIYANFF